MSGKVPPRPQQSKQARKIAVRQHERTLKPPGEKPRKRTWAQRFRGRP